MFHKLVCIVGIWMVVSSGLRGQSLFETAGNDTLKDQYSNRNIELGGYVRGDIFVGEENSQAVLSSGYGEAALKMKFSPVESFSIVSEFRLRSGYEYGKALIHPELREAYADLNLGRMDFRVGHRIIAWGRADGINPTDNLTPRNYFVRSPEPDDMRMANYLFECRYRISENVRLEGIWVPFYRYSIYRFDLFEMPDYVKFRNPGNLEWENSGGNTGLKAEFMFPGIDGSLSWFSGFDPQPGINIANLGLSLSGLSLDLESKAFRQNTIGADFATAIGSIGIRGEAGLRIPVKKYKDEIFSPETDLRYVLGADRSFGVFNLMVQYIGQWVINYTAMPELMLFDDSGGYPVPDSSMYYLIPDIINEQIYGFNRLIYGQTCRVSHTLSVRPSIALFHNTLNADIFGMYNISTEEFMLMPRVSYSISDNMKITLGGQYLSGPANSLNDMAGQVLSAGFLELKWSF